MCGQTIPPTVHHFRRKVKTGERTRRISSRANPVAVTTSFGQRIVCAKCARILDMERRKTEFVQYVELGLALLLLLVALVAHFLS